MSTEPIYVWDEGGLYRTQVEWRRHRGELQERYKNSNEWWPVTRHPGEMLGTPLLRLLFPGAE